MDGDSGQRKRKEGKILETIQRPLEEATNHASCTSDRRSCNFNPPKTCITTTRNLQNRSIIRVIPYSSSQNKSIKDKVCNTFSPPRLGRNRARRNNTTTAMKMAFAILLLRERVSCNVRSIATPSPSCRTNFALIGGMKVNNAFVHRHERPNLQKRSEFKTCAVRTIPDGVSTFYDKSQSFCFSFRSRLIPNGYGSRLFSSSFPDPDPPGKEKNEAESIPPPDDHQEGQQYHRRRLALFDDHFFETVDNAKKSLGADSIVDRFGSVDSFDDVSMDKDSTSDDFNRTGNYVSDRYDNDFLPTSNEPIVPVDTSLEDISKNFDDISSNPPTGGYIRKEGFNARRKGRRTIPPALEYDSDYAEIEARDFATRNPYENEYSDEKFGLPDSFFDESSVSLPKNEYKIDPAKKEAADSAEKKDNSNRSYSFFEEISVSTLKNVDDETPYRSVDSEKVINPPSEPSLSKPHQRQTHGKTSLPPKFETQEIAANDSDENPTSSYSFFDEISVSTQKDKGKIRTQSTDEEQKTYPLYERTSQASYSRQTQRIHPLVTRGNRVKADDLLPETETFLSEASSGYGVTNDEKLLEEQIKKLTEEMIELNNGKEFNPNSPKQVSEILFGKSHTESTNKDVLEAMAGAGNVMADKVLRYRKCNYDLRKAKARKKGAAGNKVSMSNAATTNSTIGTNSVQNDEAKDPLVIIDASAFIFRSYYSMPPLHRSDGMPTGAVLGFCNMINRLVLDRLIRGERPRLVLAFDSRGKNFRHDLYDKYKANRPPCPEDLIPQFDLVREASSAFGIPQLEAEGYEADDVIATLGAMALDAGINVDVISSDKDLMQLVTPPDATTHLQMTDPMKMSKVNHESVVEKWDVPPEKLGDVLALAGDSSDNIPGVPGIGPKTAAALINEYGGLEQLLKNADSIPQKGRREKIVQFADQARLSRKLVELERSIPIELINMPSDNIGDIRSDPLDEERLLQFYDDMGFRDISKRTITRLRIRQSSKKAKSSFERDKNFVSVSNPVENSTAKMQESMGKSPPHLDTSYDDVPF